MLPVCVPRILFLYGAVLYIYIALFLTLTPLHRTLPGIYIVCLLFYDLATSKVI